MINRARIQAMSRAYSMARWTQSFLIHHTSIIMGMSRAQRNPLKRAQQARIAAYADNTTTHPREDIRPLATAHDEEEIILALIPATHCRNAANLQQGSSQDSDPVVRRPGGATTAHDTDGPAPPQPPSHVVDDDDVPSDVTDAADRALIAGHLARKRARNSSAASKRKKYVHSRAHAGGRPRRHKRTNKVTVPDGTLGDPEWLIEPRHVCVMAEKHKCHYVGPSGKNVATDNKRHYETQHNYTFPLNMMPQWRWIKDEWGLDPALYPVSRRHTWNRTLSLTPALYAGGRTFFAHRYAGPRPNRHC